MFATPASASPCSRPFPGPTGRAAALVGAAPAARADDAPPSYYAAALAGTTVAHRPSGGSLAGWQRDITTSVGLGRMVTDTLALEREVAPTFVSGSYAARSLVPGVVWAFSPHVYAAARFVVPLDPQLDLGLYPGVGLIRSFARSVARRRAQSVQLRRPGQPRPWRVADGGALYAF